MNNREDAIELAEHSVKRLQAKMDLFVESFNKDPAEALSWSLNTFENASQLKIWKFVLKCLNGTDKPMPVNDILQGLHKMAWRAIRSPHRSTSPLANLGHECEGSAAADAYEELLIYKDL